MWFKPPFEVTADGPMHERFVVRNSENQAVVGSHDYSTALGISHVFNLVKNTDPATLLQIQDEIEKEVEKLTSP